MPLVAPRVAAPLHPGSGRRSWRCGPSTTLVSDGRAGAGADRPRADRRLGVSFPDAAAAGRPSAGGGATPPTSSASSSSSCGRAAAGGFYVDGAGRRGRSALAAHYRDTPPAASTRTSSVSSVFDHPIKVVARPRAAARALGDPAARPAPRRLPHRLRPRRQRSQGGGGDRRPGRVQRGDGLGSVPQAGSAVSLRRHHGLAEARPPRTCRASTRSAAAPPAST